LDTAGATEFFNVSGVVSSQSSAAAAESVLPVACNVTGLYVRVDTTPGGAATRTFTLVRNTSSEGDMVCSIADPAVACSDTTDSVAFNAGDRIAVQADNAGGPAAAIGQWGILCQ
jgi:hypothetical protein